MNFSNLFEKAYAQIDFPTIKPIDPDKFKNVADLFVLIVNGLLIIAGALAVIYIIWSGFMFITSAGNPEQAQKARSGLIFAVVGVIVIAFSFTIVNVVSEFLNRSPSETQSQQQPNPRSISNPDIFDKSNPGRLPRSEPDPCTERSGVC